MHRRSNTDWVLPKGTRTQVTCESENRRQEPNNMIMSACWLVLVIATHDIYNCDFAYVSCVGKNKSTRTLYSQNASDGQYS